MQDRPLIEIDVDSSAQVFRKVVPSSQVSQGHIRTLRQEQADIHAPIRRFAQGLTLVEMKAQIEEDLRIPVASMKLVYKGQGVPHVADPMSHAPSPFPSLAMASLHIAPTAMDSQR